MRMIEQNNNIQLVDVIRTQPIDNYSQYNQNNNNIDDSTYNPIIYTISEPVSYLPTVINVNDNIGPYEPPYGKWRDGLFYYTANIWPSCLCVVLGINTFGFSPIYLSGQISSRLGWLSTKEVLISYCILFVITWIIGISMAGTNQNTGGTSFLFNIPYIFAYAFVISLRFRFVQYFHINESNNTTFFIALFCNPCSLCQMARHMYGYKKALDGDSQLDGMQKYD